MKDNYREIDLSIIAKVFTKKLHFIIFGAAIFGLIGLGAGYVYSTYFAPTAVKSEAKPLEVFSQDSIEEDVNYYYETRSKLTSATENVQLYIDYILYNQDYEQLDELAELQAEFNEFSQKDVEQYSTYISVNYAVFPELMEWAKLYHAGKIADAQAAVLQAQAAIEVLGLLGIDEVESEDFEDSYTELIDSALSLPASAYEMQTSSHHLQLLNSSSLSDIQNTSKQADEYITNLNAELKVLIDELNVVMGKVAKDNNLIIDHGYGVGEDTLPDEFGVKITHTFIQPDKTDDIMAFTVFFTLAGTCLGFLFGLVKLAKISGDDKAK